MKPAIILRDTRAVNDAGEEELAGKYAILPVGAAILLLLATPVMGTLATWPVLAATLLAGGLIIPFMLHGLTTRKREAGVPGGIHRGSDTDRDLPD